MPYHDKPSGVSITGGGESAKEARTPGTGRHGRTKKKQQKATQARVDKRDSRSRSGIPSIESMMAGWSTRTPKTGN